MLQVPATVGVHEPTVSTYGLPSATGFVALALFAPFMVNSVLFHVFLERTGLPMSLVFLALELFLAWSYRGAYRTMLAAKVGPG